MLAETGLCENPDYGAEIREKCPQSCGVCPGQKEAATAEAMARHQQQQQAAAATPPAGTCVDSATTGYDLKGAPAACSMLAEAGLCENPDHGAEIREKCPLSCRVCAVVSTGAGSVGAGVGGTGHCEDVEVTGYDLKGAPAPCSLLAETGLCDHTEHAAEIKQKCPQSCGICGSQMPLPPADVNPVNPAGGCVDVADTHLDIDGSPASCPTLAQAGLCTHPTHSVDVKRKCPLSCGLCGTQSQQQAPTMAADACSDREVTGYDFKGTPASCDQIAQNGLCNHESLGDSIKEVCPASCGVCGATPVLGECIDTEVTGFDLKGAAGTCAQLAQAGLCEHAEHAAEINKKCPLSCGLCGGAGEKQQAPSVQEQPPRQPPPAGCADQAASGYNLKGAPAPCSMLLQYGLCTHAEHGPAIRQACPVSCDACDTFVPPAAAATTPALATPASTPTIETEKCVDAEITGLNIDGGPASCNQLVLKNFCTHAQFGAEILRKCPVACGICTAEQAAEAMAATEAAAAGKAEEVATEAAKATALAADVVREYAGRASVIENARAELAAALIGRPCSEASEFHLCTLLPATCAWDLASETCRDLTCLDIAGETECVGSGCEYVAELYACRKAGEELPCSVFWEEDNCPADRCHYTGFACEVQRDN